MHKKTSVGGLVIPC